MHLVLIVLLGWFAWKMLIIYVRLLAVLFVVSFQIAAFLARLPWLFYRWCRGDQIVWRPGKPSIPMPDLRLDANSVHNLKDDRPIGYRKVRIMDWNPNPELESQRYERRARERKNRPPK